MRAVAAAAERLRAPVARPPALRAPLRAAAGLALLTGISLALRSEALHARYWIDEGLSVGIASHPVLDIPSTLRQDGSPPLYYLLLAGWMQAFAHGEAATHALSLTFALLAVPTAFLAARALFGRRAGWIAALLVALNPFLTVYAQETRMYALVALLSVAATATFALAFVRRRRGWRWAFAGSLALLAYTHYWGLFLIFGSAVALVLIARAAGDRRRLLGDAALAYGAAALAYLPWIPSLVFQLARTGAPWSERPTPQRPLDGLISLLGGATASMAFALGAASGLPALLARRRAPDARAALALLTMAAAAIVLAWVASQLSPAWARRYLAVLLGPLLLVGAAALARAGAPGMVAAVLLAILWADPRTAAIEAKSNAHTTAALVRHRLKPGDLVVSTHPEQLPVVHHYLARGPGLRWANAMGYVREPRTMDWRDALARLRAAAPEATSDRFLRQLRPGRQLLLIQPIIGSAPWRAPWTQLVRRRAAQWERMLDADPRLARTLAVPRLRGRPLPRGVRAVLYERLPAR